MYIKLKSIKYIPNEHGTITTYHPGDWVDVGRQTAQLWIAAGDAELLPAQRLELLPADCAILVRGAGNVPGNISGIAVERCDFMTSIALPHSYCLFYTAGTTLRGDLLHVGFNLLSKWDLVVPLWSYQQVAGHLGTEEDRAATREVIRDLRVPAYDTRLVFVRKNDAGESLIALWHDEMTRADLHQHDERLAFMRALWIVKPRICAAPVSWVGKTSDQ